jgi:hypothetical protein
VDRMNGDLVNKSLVAMRSLSARIFLMVSALSKIYANIGLPIIFANDVCVWIWVLSVATRFVRSAFTRAAVSYFSPRTSSIHRDTKGCGFQYLKRFRRICSLLRNK